MNYFAHALPFLDQPYFVAGTAVPDWLSVVDRQVRVRRRHAEPLANAADATARSIPPRPPWPTACSSTSATTCGSTRPGRSPRPRWS